MRIIVNSIAAISGFLAMFDLTKVAFNIGRAPNLFVAFGRLLIEFIAGCAGYIICFMFLLFTESIFELILKRLRKGNDV